MQGCCRCRHRIACRRRNQRARIREHRENQRCSNDEQHRILQAGRKREILPEPGRRLQPERQEEQEVHCLHERPDSRSKGQWQEPD